MRKLIYFNSILLVLLSFSIQLFAQFKNKNEYIKLNDELFCQYSPIEKGWAIFKFDNKSQTYIKQEYTESPDIKKSYFESIYVVGDREFYIYNGKAYKSISGYSNEIYSSEYKELLIYNLPQADKVYPHTVGLTFENKYISLHDRPMSCDTFIIQNGTFFPIFKKDNPKISENIFTQNGLIVPNLYGNSGYSYTIRKTSQGYILSDRRIMIPQMGYLIHSYPEMGYAHKNPEVNKLFKPGINLSYYDGKNFLISEKNKWYICKVSANETDFNDYLTDLKRVLPQNETLYQYFGTIEANSIKVLTWNSGKPEYFVANINGIDYLYDYKKAAIKNINKNITFPIVENISGDYIRAYYPPDVYRDYKPMYLEVKQGNNLYFYNYVNNEFKKFDKNPFVGYYKATFIGSTYKEFDNSGQILSEKTFKPSMTKEEVAAEIKRQAEEEEFARKEKLRIQSEGLKSAIMDSKLRYDLDGGFLWYGSFQFFHDFPMKYYNGSQPYLENMTGIGVGGGYKFELSVVNNGKIEKVEVDNSQDVYAVGSSGRTERFSYYGEFNLANINTGYFNQVGLAKNSYDNKYYLITKKFKLANSTTSFASSEIIPCALVFSENPDIKNKDEVKFFYRSRLSNNNILIIFKVSISYLSNQLNSMFGIGGMNNISRKLGTETYYKFVVLSADGKEIIANNNYLLPIKYIRPIDGGFVILSESLGNVISLSQNDFGRKSTVYSQAEGRNIIVTEGLNFSSNESNIPGIRIFKFDNYAKLVKEITVDNPSDERIKKPKLIYIQESENYLCMLYASYEKNVINEGVCVFNLYDFELNLKSTIITNAGYYVNPSNPYYFEWPEGIGFITSINDIFYQNELIGRYNAGYDFKVNKEAIPFKLDK
ncbi:MAG TPA: hypothetical protein PLN58_06365 [Bacilli bacterium]|nr:hypothetical protein [Bacilli bacterium]